MLNQCKRKQVWGQKRNKTKEITQNMKVNNKPNMQMINYK